MLDLTSEVDGVSFRALNSALNRAQRESGKSAVGSVIWAARRVCIAGRGRSKMGQKKRRLFAEPISDSVKSRRPGHKKQFYVKRYKQSGSGGYVKQIVGSGNAMKDVRNSPAVEGARKIKRRGLAKTVWKVMGYKVGKTGAGRAGRTAYKNGRVVKKLRPTNPEILLNNKLTYLESAYPGITQDAINAGAKALEQQLDRRLRKVWNL